MTSGEVSPGFSAVRDAFDANFSSRGELGAALCVVHRGRAVVDLSGGTDGWGRPYTAETLQVVFSATKGAAALCTALLLERGLLVAERPVAHYWPEFAQSGKGAISVASVLSHRAGLAAVDRHLTLDDVFAGKPVVEALAAQRPLWRPGAAHGYHAVTFGFLVGELVERVTGMTLGQFFEREVREPLGLRFWIGLPADQERWVAPLLDPPLAPSVGSRLLFAVARRSRHLLWRSLTLDGALSVGSAAAIFNSRQAHEAELVSAGGIGNARSLAWMYAAALGPISGTRILSPEGLRTVVKPRSQGRDRCMLTVSRFGLGYGLHSPMSPFTTVDAFGHYGIGGSFGFADPGLDLAAGYVTSQMPHDATKDPRIGAIMAAITASANRC
jgi:CubicO group peptidase (beta-lactamase class C family)